MPAKPATQSTLSVIDIKNDIVIMTDHRYRTVFKVKAINFDLLSPEEQDSIIYAYASLINSLEHPIQILIKTRQLNIDSYISYLETHRKNQSNPALKAQIESYQKFVQKLVIENNVLFKNFYVVVPYDGMAVNKSSIFDPLTSALPNKTPTTSKYSAKEFTEVKEKLDMMTQNLMDQFQRIGLQTTRLDSPNLVNIFYSLYNPEEETSNQRVEQPIGEYTTTLVKPAIQ